jgi:hypothetical protein
MAPELTTIDLAPLMHQAGGCPKRRHDLQVQVIGARGQRLVPNLTTMRP